MTTTDHTDNGLDEKLSYLKLSYMLENYESLAKKAAQKHWTHVNFLTELATAEANLRADRATKRRICAARFAQIKTLEQFKWSWPKKINQLQVKNLFRLSFVEQKSNVIFLGASDWEKPIWPRLSATMPAYRVTACSFAPRLMPSIAWQLHNQPDV